jgi:hypothetical protein
MAGKNTAAFGIYRDEMSVRMQLTRISWSGRVLRARLKQSASGCPGPLL